MSDPILGAVIGVAGWSLGYATATVIERVLTPGGN